MRTYVKSIVAAMSGARWQCCALIVLWSVAVSADGNADIYDIGAPGFDTILPAELLPDATITALARDRNGFLWIGTQGGLVRFDGYSQRVFVADANDEHAIGGNYVTALALDGEGRLWVGTIADGLSVLDLTSGRFHSFRHDPDNRETISHNRINAISVVRSGDVWVGTEQGLDHIRADSTVIRQLIDSKTDAHASREVRALLRTSTDFLWVGTSNGLRRLPLEEVADSASLASYHYGDFSGQQVDVLFEAADGAVWVGTREHGAARLEQQGVARVAALPHPRVYSITQPDRHEIWIGTRGGGIAVADASTATITRVISHDESLADSIGIDSLGALLTDDSGIVFVGTWGAGLQQYNARNRAFRTFRRSLTKPQTLSHGNVLSLLELESGHIWVGTLGNGIDVIDPKQGVIDGFRPDPERSDMLGDGAIQSLAQSADGTIWVGTQRAGLHRFEPSSRSFRRYSKSDGLADHFVRRILPDPNGSLWIATSSGLNRYDPSTDALIDYPLDRETPFSDRVITLALQDSGALWAGTSVGLFKIDPGQAHLSPVAEALLPDQYIKGLVFDLDGQLWVGSAKGLTRLRLRPGVIDAEIMNPMNHGQPVGSGRSLLDNPLVDDSGRIWSSEGMLDPQARMYYSWHRSDGVDIGTYWTGSFTKTRAGTLLFGGTRGILLVRPDLFESWDHMPEVVLSDLLIDGLQIRGQAFDHLELRPESRSVAFEFAALDHSDPQRLRYAYQLRGYDKTWIETDADRRVAGYTNLDPGSYVFTVRASNRQGIWSENVLRLPLTVLPSWYQSGWFRLLTLVSAVLVVVLASWLTIRVRTRLLRQRSAHLEELVSERNRELSNVIAEKNRLFVNISHELRTPLTLIMGAMQRLESKVAGEPSFEIKMATRNTRRLSRLVEHVLRIARIDQAPRAPQSVSSALKATLGCFETLAIKQGLTIWIDGEPPNRDVYCVPDMLETILMNLISNAIKYTKRGGNIKVSARDTGPYLMIEVHDSGIGLSEHDQSQIFDRFGRAEGVRETIQGTGLGLSIVKELVESHGGEVGVKSQVGSHSTFTVRIPWGEASSVAPGAPVLATDAANEEMAAVARELADEIDWGQQTEPVDATAPEVLIIDDNPEVCELLSRSLGASHRCLVAADGATGVSLAGKHEPELIICDVMMPGMDGFEVLRLLSQDPATNHIPVVLLTALADDESRLRGLEEHAVDYVKKPFDGEELRLKIGNHLAVRAALRSRCLRAIVAGQERPDSAQPAFANDTVQLNDTSLTGRDRAFLNALRDSLATRFSHPERTVEAIASDLNISVRHLQRKVRHLTGKSTIGLLTEYRLNQALGMLADERSVKEVGFAVGWKSANQFRRAFKNRFGVTPGQWRGQNQVPSGP